MKGPIDSQYVRSQQTNGPSKNILIPKLIDYVEHYLANL